MNGVSFKFSWVQGILAAGTLGMMMLAIGCPGTADPPVEGDVIFPANYRDTFTMVRDCRNSVEHGATIRVWVNDLGVAGYLADAGTLPEGTIVVKEEFAGGGCDNDEDLQFWSVMRKEPAGFDPGANDWRFQETASPDRRITLDDKSTCISCHTAEECIPRDLMCTLP